MNNKYSISNIFKEFRENKPLIEAYLKNQPVEGLRDMDPNNSDSDTIMGLSVSVFLLLSLIMLSIWIWAIVVLVKYWKVLPDWAKIIGILGVIPIFTAGGPVLTLIVVYIAKPKS